MQKKQQSWRLLECLEDNLMMQLVRESTKGGALLDLLFSEKDWWEVWTSETVSGKATMK